LTKTVAVLTDVHRPALKEALDFAQSLDTALKADVKRVCGQTPLVPADCLALAKRLEATLEPL